MITLPKKSTKKLLKLNQHKIRLGLERVNKALKKLKINNRNYSSKILTINGTSAKNSILQIFKRIIIKQKKTFATTTSPHLVSIVERFELNGKFININLLKKILNKLSIFKNLTQFERLIVAFGLFLKNKNPQWILAEYGLFGRKDAIRSLYPSPDLHIVSPISWDHLEWTKTKKRNSKTLKEIVYEKTSFIRSRVYIAKQTPKVLKMIKFNLKNNNSEKIYYGADFKLIKKRDSFFYKDKKIKFKIKSNLIGQHNYENAVVAIKVALDQGIPLKYIKSALKNIEIKGRIQLIKKGKLRKGLKSKDLLILDGAHNEQQSSQLVRALKKFKGKEKYLVVSMINSKDPYSFLKPMKNKFKKIFFVNMERERNVIPKEKLDYIAKKLKINSATSKSFEKVKVDLKNVSKCLVVAGSLYFLGSLLKKN
tara:strand:+ start:1087 stop:2358 length:1272 start_codon:yes stop_codon:yes gene_type:complete